MNSNDVINFLGGTTEVAELCGLTTGAISQWRKNGIPKGWMRFLLVEVSKKQRRNRKAA